MYHTTAIHTHTHTYTNTHVLHMSAPTDTYRDTHMHTNTHTCTHIHITINYIVILRQTDSKTEDLLLTRFILLVTISHSVILRSMFGHI